MELSIEERVKTVFADSLGYLEVSEIKKDSDIEADLGADSIDKVEVVINLEKEFGISIQDSECENITKVQEVIELIENKIK